MPSETPRMPRETHASLLAHRGNSHMPLQAGDVASFARKPRKGHVLSKAGVAALGAAAGVAASIGFFFLVMNS